MIDILYCDTRTRKARNNTLSSNKGRFLSKGVYHSVTLHNYRIPNRSCCYSSIAVGYLKQHIIKVCHHKQNQCTSLEGYTKMLKEQRGKKLTCPNCSKKFYDLNREDFDCPMCGERYIVETEEDEVIEEVVPEPVAKDEKKSTDTDELIDDDTDLAGLVIDDDDDDDDKDDDTNDDTLLPADEDDNMSDIIDIPTTDTDDS